MTEIKQDTNLGCSIQTEVINGVTLSKSVYPQQQLRVIALRADNETGLKFREYETSRTDIPGSRRFCVIELGTSMDNADDKKQALYKDERGNWVIDAPVTKNIVETIFERSNPVNFKLLEELEDEIDAGNGPLLFVQRVRASVPGYRPFPDNPSVIVYEIEIWCFKGESPNTRLRRKIASMKGQWVEGTNLDDIVDQTLLAEGKTAKKIADTVKK